MILLLDPFFLYYRIFVSVADIEKGNNASPLSSWKVRSLWIKIKIHLFYVMWTSNNNFDVKMNLKLCLCQHEGMSISGGAVPLILKHFIRWMCVWRALRCLTPGVCVTISHRIYVSVDPEPIQKFWRRECYCFCVESNHDSPPVRTVV
jgi:hypothetical protein